MLDHKVILITGASRGIGRAIAKEVARNGGWVFINYNRSEDKAFSLKEEIEQEGGRAEVIKFDVACEIEVKDGVKEVLNLAGRIDGLVNNAGVTMNSLLPITKREKIEDLVKVNLFGAIYCSKHVLKSMLKNGGSIVNITSVVGETGNPGQSVYAAAKGGIIGFTKALAREVASKGIRVNGVSPGYIMTEMTESLPEQAKENIKNLIPLGRFGYPEEVARIVVFLLSDLSSYITGEIIKVNGGLYM